MKAERNWKLEVDGVVVGSVGMHDEVASIDLLKIKVENEFGLCPGHFGTKNEKGEMVLLNDQVAIKELLDLEGDITVFPVHDTVPLVQGEDEDEDVDDAASVSSSCSSSSSSSDSSSSSSSSNSDQEEEEEEEEEQTEEVTQFMGGLEVTIGKMQSIFPNAETFAQFLRFMGARKVRMKRLGYGMLLTPKGKSMGKKEAKTWEKVIVNRLSGEEIAQIAWLVRCGPKRLKGRNLKKMAKMVKKANTPMRKFGGRRRGGGGGGVGRRKRRHGKGKRHGGRGGGRGGHRHQGGHHYHHHDGFHHDGPPPPPGAPQMFGGFGGRGLFGGRGPFGHGGPPHGGPFGPPGHHHHHGPQGHHHHHHGPPGHHHHHHHGPPGQHHHDGLSEKRKHRSIENKKKIARLVKHRNVLDNTEFEPGTKFAKIWVMRNDSQQAWPNDANLVHVGGDDLGSTSETKTSPLPPLQPGQVCDVQLGPLQAPQLPGLYKGYWRLQGQDGEEFGQRIWCQIFSKEKEENQE